MRGARDWARRARDVTYYLGLLPAGRRHWRHIPRFFREARAYREALPLDGSFAFSWDAVQPMLSDYAEAAGSASGHYFHQDLWAARRIHAQAPRQHVDIGSRIDGFVSHVLTFMPVTVVDIRPLASEVDGLTFVRGDICSLSDFASNSIESLSSLHAIEHVGLGRYGDPIGPESWRTALVECARVIAPGGHFYLGTPVGRERLNFNSGRVFAPKTIIDAVADLRLASFAAVDDAGRFVNPADPGRLSMAEYACGLFEFIKP
jgi:SAM-dependent methyltransferase